MTKYGCGEKAVGESVLLDSTVDEVFHQFADDEKWSNCSVMSHIGYVKLFVNRTHQK